jgi:hypothetical protein
MAHVHDKQRIKMGNNILCLSCTWSMLCFLSLFFVYHVHGPCFVSCLYSLFIMYMGHVLFPIFILCLSCTWAMFCFPSLFFVYHVHGPCFVSYLYSLFIMYMGHVLFPIFILCLSCTWAMFCFPSLVFVYYVHGLGFYKTWPMYMINKE